MENVFAKFMGAVSSAPIFALDVLALAGLNKSENETVAQAFEVHKIVTRQGKKALEQNQPRYHVVAPGNSLSNVAQQYYGSGPKWPVVFEANRDVIGPDPGSIKPGQRLLIPALPAVAGIKG
jgi:nucleoid-associated protein YgaU